MSSWEELGESIYGAGDAIGSRQLAALHVGLQLDVFAPRQLAHLARVVHQHLGQPTGGAPLGLRLRLAQACRGAAVAIRDSSDTLVGTEVSTVTAMLEQLLDDRDASVATSAAATLGALWHQSPIASRILETAAGSVRGRRRMAAARAVRWALGESGAEALDAVLDGEDGFAVAEVVRALGLWRASAPQTIDAAVMSLTEGRFLTEVHVAATEYACGVDDGASRIALVKHLSSTARAAQTGFSLWTTTAERAWRVLERVRDLRSRARTSLSHAADASIVFHEVVEAIAWAEQHESGAAVEAVDDALDLVLLTSTLVADLLTASAQTDADARAKWREWADAMLALRTHRFASLARSGRDPLVVRAAVRRLTRITDASPRSLQNSSADLPPIVVLREARDRLSRNKERMLERPVARLYALAAEVAPVEARPVDALASMLPFSRRILQHFVGQFDLRGLENVIRAVVALEPILTEIKKSTAEDLTSRRVRRRLAGDLDARLAELDRAMDLAEDGALSIGLDYLVRACRLHLRSTTRSEALEVQFERGVDNLERALHEALARCGFETSATPISTPPKRVRRLMQHVGVVDASVRADIARVLPASFDGLLEAVFRLPGALDPEAQGPAPGAVIGDYVVVRSLGAGGMGSCVLVKSRSTRNATEVVLKMPRKTTGVHRTLFRSEALALLRLADAPHAGIVRFLAFNDGAGVAPHLVMEHVDGASLESHLSRGPLPDTVCIDVLRALAFATAHAHERDIGHHDIKPANIMLTSGEAKPVLVDWGIAGGTLRRNLGTPLYMAPERFGLSEPTGSVLAGDVYALACVFYEMLSGKPLLGGPFSDEDERVRPGVGKIADSVASSMNSMVVAQVIATDAELARARLERAARSCSPPLVRLVSAMLESDPASRPTARTVAMTLAGLTF